MAYTVILKRSAEKELDRLQQDVHRRITKKLVELEDDPRPPGMKRLQGSDGYRIRVGDWRILYVVNDETKTVEVVAVGRRREVYR